MHAEGSSFRAHVSVDVAASEEHLSLCLAADVTLHSLSCVCASCDAHTGSAASILVAECSWQGHGASSSGCLHLHLS